MWLAPDVITRLGAMRGPGESFSDVIQRLIETEGHYPAAFRQGDRTSQDRGVIPVASSLRIWKPRALEAGGGKRA
jgi:hypothetical protein